MLKYLISINIKNEIVFLQFIQLNTDGMVIPAPVVRRPYDSMNSPYPPSCSRLCNHPVSNDLKREYNNAAKKAKDSHVSQLFVYVFIFKAK